MNAPIELTISAQKLREHLVNLGALIVYIFNMTKNIPLSFVFLKSLFETPI